MVLSTLEHDVNDASKTEGDICNVNKTRQKDIIAVEGTCGDMSNIGDTTVANLRS